MTVQLLGDILLEEVEGIVDGHELLLLLDNFLFELIYGLKVVLRVGFAGSLLFLLLIFQLELSLKS